MQYLGIVREAGDDPEAQGREAARMVRAVEDEVRSHRICCGSLDELIEDLDQQLRSLKQERERSEQNLHKRVSWRLWQLREWWREARPAGRMKSMTVGSAKMGGRQNADTIVIDDEAWLLERLPEAAKTALNKAVAKKFLKATDEGLVLEGLGDLVPPEVAHVKPGTETLTLEVGGVEFKLHELQPVEDDAVDEEAAP